MGNRRLRRLVYGALLLALAVGVQNLRLLLPLPPFGSMFIIGSLVNMLLLLSGRLAGLAYTIGSCLLLAGVAFLQGQLPIFFVVPVAIGNGILAFWGAFFWDRPLLWLAPFIKAVCLWTMALFLLSQVVHMPEAAGAALLFMMSWPQIITGLGGVILARFIWQRLELQRRIS